MSPRVPLPLVELTGQIKTEVAAVVAQIANDYADGTAGKPYEASKEIVRRPPVKLEGSRGRNLAIQDRTIRLLNMLARRRSHRLDCASKR